MKKIILLLLLTLSLTGCNSINSASSAETVQTETKSAVNDPSLWAKSSNTTWQTLQHTPLRSLQEEAQTNQNPNAQGWLRLAIISKQYSTNNAELLRELQAWRRSFPSHPGNQLLPNDDTLEALSNQSRPKHIAVLLPLHGEMSSSGQVVRSGFLSAYYNNANQGGEKQALSFYDTNDSTDLAALYQKAVNEGADIVVGPLTKPQVEALRRSTNFNVRTLTLNYSSPSFFSGLPAQFYEFGLSPENETQQLADKATQAGLSHALIIASDDAWGHRVVSALNSRFKSNGGNTLETLYFTKNSDLTQNIAALLHINPKEDRALAREDNKKSILAEQRRQDFNVIFLFAQPDMARQIVPLLRFYYAGNVPIYSISSIYSGRPNPQKDRDLNGVTFCELPWIVQMAHSSSSDPAQYNRLYAIGRDAYLLSQSLPRLNDLPNFPIYGATGALEMDQQRVHQRLPWVTMRGGQI